jgi:hypothetical protein
MSAIALKKKTCIACGELTYIFSHKRCRRCADRENRAIKLFKMKPVLDEDKKFLNKCWLKLPRLCEECGEPIEKSKECYHHLLPKSKYDSHRHDIHNILPLCLSCHSKAESAISYPKMKIYELAEAMKKALLKHDNLLQPKGRSFKPKLNDKEQSR